MIDSISLSRVFIPQSTGWSLHGRTFGLPRGLSMDLYKYFSGMANVVDDRFENKAFYDLLESAYKIRLAEPVKLPFVMYVDYVKSIGGRFSENNIRAIQHLRLHCNTLIVQCDEFEYLKNEYLNGRFSKTFDLRCDMIPARFRNLGR